MLEHLITSPDMSLGRVDSVGIDRFLESSCETADLAIIYHVSRSSNSFRVEKTFVGKTDSNVEGGVSGNCSASRANFCSGRDEELGVQC